MPVDENELDEVLRNARELALSDDHPLNSMTIKDLKLASDTEGAVLSNDQAASIISVFIITT